MASPKTLDEPTIKPTLEHGKDDNETRLDVGDSIDACAERTLVRKFDFRILPVLAIMYLFNSLDKSNLGNAKTAGLEGTYAPSQDHRLLHVNKGSIEALNLHGDQYNIILSIFFIPYVLTAPFLGILGKMYGPNLVLPCMMLTFGLCTLLVVAVFNFGGLLAIRWFLGMSESAFFPLVIYYLTT
jgi:MFS family permease